MGSSRNLSLDRVATARRSDAAMRANVRVDRAARVHSTFAGPSLMRNTLPPFRSNELFDAVPVAATSVISFQAAASLFNAMNVQAADNKSTKPNISRAFGAPSSITKAVR